MLSTMLNAMLDAMVTPMLGAMLGAIPETIADGMRLICRILDAICKSLLYPRLAAWGLFLGQMGAEPGRLG